MTLKVILLECFRAEDLFNMCLPHSPLFPSSHLSFIPVHLQLPPNASQCFIIKVWHNKSWLEGKRRKSNLMWIHFFFFGIQIYYCYYEGKKAAGNFSIYNTTSFCRVDNRTNRTLYWWSERHDRLEIKINSIYKQTSKKNQKLLHIVLIILCAAIKVPKFEPFSENYC